MAAVAVTLTADLVSGQLLDILVGSPGYAFTRADVILGKIAQSSTPTDISTAAGFKIAQGGEWSNEELYIWRGSSADRIYVAISRSVSVPIMMYSARLPVAASGVA